MATVSVSGLTEAVLAGAVVAVAVLPLHAPVAVFLACNENKVMEGHGRLWKVIEGHGKSWKVVESSRNDSTPPLCPRSSITLT